MTPRDEIARGAMRELIHALGPRLYDQALGDKKNEDYQQVWRATMRPIVGMAYAAADAMLHESAKENGDG